MISSYRKFIKILAKPRRVCANQQVKIPHSCCPTKTAFGKLKPRPSTDLFSNVSLRALDAVLTQTKNGVKHPESYASRQMSKHEVNWSVSEKELLTIVWASKHFKCYIFGRFIQLFTVHQQLSDFKQSGEPSNRRTLVQTHEKTCWIKLPNSPHFRSFEYICRVFVTSKLCFQHYNCCSRICSYRS